MSEAKAEQDRKSQKFWAIDDFWNVVEVTGYECPPNKDVWWVPELGYSMTVGYHLFADQAAARQRAIGKLKSNIADLQRALSRLQPEVKP